MVKAVLFDMDNTLIDSIKMQRRSYGILMAELGRKLDDDDLEISQYIIHFEEPRNWELIRDKYGLVETIDELMERRNVIYENLLKNHIVMRPGVEKLLNYLKDKGIKMAIGSNSHMAHILAAVEGMGKKDYFYAISSAEFLPRKPAPDIFLDAAKQLSVSPHECIVIEDAELGIQAGKNAGMKVIAVPNSISKETEDMSEADIELESLENFDYNLISS